MQQNKSHCVFKVVSKHKKWLKYWHREAAQGDWSNLVRTPLKTFSSVGVLFSAVSDGRKAVEGGGYSVPAFVSLPPSPFKVMA